MTRRLSRADLARLASGRLPDPTENEVQAVIVDGLRAHRYLVQITSRRVKRCRYCGKTPHIGDGASKGIADLLVRHQDWPPFVWMALEVKRGGTVRYTSFQQRLLAENRAIKVVQSLEEALEAARKF